MIRSTNATWRHNPDEFRELAARLNTPAGVHGAVEHIWADVQRNPTPTNTEPYHGDLIPDVEFLSDVECDARADRDALMRGVA